MKRIGYLVVGLTCLGGAFARGPEKVEPPQWLRLKASDMYLRFDVENEEERLKLSRSESAQREEQLELTPSLGMSLVGSVFHSKFFEYQTSGELGWTEGERRLSGGGREEIQDNPHFDLLRLNANVTLFKEKLHATSLFAQRDRSRRDYDHFRSFTTESTRVGGRLQLHNGSLPIHLRVSRWEESVRDPNRPGTREENTVNLTANHQRSKRDKSRFRYTYNGFDQVDGGREYQGTSHTAQFSNRQDLLASGDLRSVSVIYYNDLDTDVARNQSLTVRENLTLDPGDGLSFAAEYLFGYRDTDGLNSTRHFVDGYAEHQLYESLKSRVGVESLWTQAHGIGDGFDGQRYGPYVVEEYTKRIGEWGELRAGAEVRWLDENRKDRNNRQTVRSEGVRLESNRPVLLHAPGVQLETIRVRDASGRELYREGFDYRLIQRGEFVEIQRVFAGPIPEGNSVEVDYVADVSGPQNVRTTESGGHVELELFKRLLLLHARIRNVDNSNGRSLSFQDLDDLLYGAALRVKMFEFGVDWQNYMADFISYDSIRFFEKCTLDLGTIATLVLHFDQSTTTYPELNDERDVQSGQALLRTHLTPRTQLNLRGGFYDERGDRSDRRLSTLAADLKYRIGLLNASVSYQYEDEQQAGEERDRHYLYFKSERRF
ncbi:MAG: hypothetical protein ACI9TH_000055 [Kiritimatiellia bacterium]|jgi:hypothetical protein